MRTHILNELCFKNFKVIYVITLAPEQSGDCFRENQDCFVLTLKELGHRGSGL